MNTNGKTDPGKENTAPVPATVGLTFEQAVELRLAAIVAEQGDQRKILTAIHKGLKGLGTTVVQAYERKIKKLEKRVAALENGR